MPADTTVISENHVGSKTSAQRKTFDVDTLRLFLSYEPDTGRLFWRERAESWFSSPAYAAGWNTRYAGREVTGKNSRCDAITVLPAPVPAHRIRRF